MRAPLTAILALDQASRTGWAFGLLERRRVLAHGVVTGWQEREDIVTRAVRAAGSPAQLIVLFEDHSTIATEYLTRKDPKHKGPPQRSKKSLAGLHKAKGWWEQELGKAGHPERLQLSIPPREWRARVLGDQWADKDAAMRWASAFIGRPVTDDNEAEGLALCALGLVEGPAMVEGRKLKQRLYARGRREERRQMVLGEAKP